MSQVFYDSATGKYYTQPVSTGLNNVLGGIANIGTRAVPQSKNYINDPSKNKSMVDEMLQRAQNSFNQTQFSNPTAMSNLFPSLQSPIAGNPTVNSLYQNVLGRMPEQEGLNYWQSQFGSSIDPSEYQTFLNAAQSEIQSRGLQQPSYNPFQAAPSYAGSSGAGRFLGNISGSDSMGGGLLT
jgi:hypothetical protein